MLILTFAAIARDPFAKSIPPELITPPPSPPRAELFLEGFESAVPPAEWSLSSSAALPHTWHLLADSSAAHDGVHAAHAAIDPLLRGAVRGITAIEPNPSRGGAAVAFELTREGPAQLRIVDVAGREIRSLQRAVLPAGLYRALWDGREESGAESAAGIYFAVLEAEGAVSMRKVVLLR